LIPESRFAELYDNSDANSSNKTRAGKDSEKTPDRTHNLQDSTTDWESELAVMLHIRTRKPSNAHRGYCVSLVPSSRSILPFSKVLTVESVAES
jgi:hypothetical protein